MLAAAAPLLTGCLGEGPTEPGTEPDPLALGEQIFGAGQVHWFIPDAVGAWTMRPLLDGPRVYFDREYGFTGGRVTGMQQLRALERESGALLWAGEIISAENAALAGSTVGAVWGGLPVFDRESGAPVQTFRYGETSLSTNVVSDGERFYTGTHDGHVLAVDPYTGAVLWDRTVKDGGDTGAVGLALEGEHVAATFVHRLRSVPWTAPDSGFVVLFDRTTGEMLWRVALPSVSGSRRALPLITHGLVVVQSDGYQVLALDLATGALRWQRDVTFRKIADSDGLAACDGLVIAATGDLGVIALDAESGAVRWHRSNLQGASLRRIDCAHGTVLVHGAYLEILDAESGASRARYPRKEPYIPGREFMITSATRDDESLYVGTTYGYARVRAP